MARTKSESRELKNIGYEMFIGALSILSILNLVLSYFFRDNQNLQYVVLIMNAFFMPIFLGDFLYRIFTTHAKSDYFFRNFGWADLLSSLPFPQTKILRMFRLWRVVRLARNFGIRNLMHEFIDNRAGNALLTVIFLVFCVLEFGSLAVLGAESSSPDANITNASSALWWTYVTITTVGYGDRYPVTNAGRLVGVLVMTAGVGLFGTLSGFLANTFLAPPKKRKEPEPTANGPNDVKARMAEIQCMLNAQDQAVSELRAKLEEMSKLLWPDESSKG
jgi:voltage-gated potassium channel Kch